MNGNIAREKIKSFPLVSSLIKKFRKQEKKKRMLRFYNQFINRGDLCFDVGANRGDWSEIFLSLGARVIAIEPQTDCANSLRKRFEKRFAFTLLQKGVGEKEELKELRVAGNLINSTFSDEFIEKYKHYDYARWPSKEMVQVTTLDNLIAQFGLPRFCKIDAEGYELEILKGLSRPIRFIQFEYVPPFREQILECIDVLSGLADSRFNYYPYEEMRLELIQWATADEMKTIVHSFPEDFLVCDIMVEFVGLK